MLERAEKQSVGELHNKAEKAAESTRKAAEYWRG